ncbi:hypothetical protein EYF80_001546 [Liparis tanakae]|uniref:Uncharacterized protein n=1 Tax=Liparis tanakae TaxID=230148 RepID=A0A4Z2JDT8_9TELE|nr:hypothetical protein EYF80_001546 [Liparis tanakae]
MESGEEGMVPGVRSLGRVRHGIGDRCRLNRAKSSRLTGDHFTVACHMMIVVVVMVVGIMMGWADFEGRGVPHVFWPEWTRPQAGFRSNLPRVRVSH